ncbi:MAG TPA: hypothetical protein VHD57_18815 [Vicinamibacterales bacterium]|jgi:hypothetical protein|nr:hypothetical protein [Vicinamibacterales bacterium]
MKLTVIAGVVLIVLGAIALIYQGISYRSRETVLDVGPLHATAERQKTLPLPPVIGGVVLVGGVILVVVGMRRRA